eukprot:75816-Chlamydomonas_euryale.AAC.8
MASFLGGLCRVACQEGNLCEAGMGGRSAHAWQSVASVNPHDMHRGAFGHPMNIGPPKQTGPGIGPGWPHQQCAVVAPHPAGVLHLRGCLPVPCAIHLHACCLRPMHPFSNNEDGTCARAHGAALLVCL